MAEAVARFPDVGGFVLTGRRVRLPSDLPERSLTVVAFRKWHQRLVEGWIDWSQRNHPDLPDDSTVAALVLGRDGTVHACACGPVGPATTAVVEAAVTQAGG